MPLCSRVSGSLDASQIKMAKWGVWYIKEYVFRFEKKHTQKSLGFASILSLFFDSSAMRADQELEAD